MHQISACALIRITGTTYDTNDRVCTKPVHILKKFSGLGNKFLTLSIRHTGLENQEHARHAVTSGDHQHMFFIERGKDGIEKGWLPVGRLLVSEAVDTSPLISKHVTATRIPPPAAIGCECSAALPPPSPPPPLSA